MTTTGVPPTGPLPDPVDEARRILAAADDAGVPLRAIGGVAVALRAPSLRRLYPARTFHDLDVVTRSGQRLVPAALERLGYVPDRRFNALHGAERLLFHDVNGRRLDVFVDRLRMCHDLVIGERLLLDRETVPLADLLLTKLQVVELTERDRQDVVALLVDQPLAPSDDGISYTRIEAVCGADWGWWRTVTGTLDDLAEWTSSGAGGATDREAVGVATARIADLRRRLTSGRRTWRWQARALVGERICWYDLPEEVR